MGRPTLMELAVRVLRAIVEDLRASGHYLNDDDERRRLMVEALDQVGRDRENERRVKRRHYFTPPPRRAG